MMNKVHKEFTKELNEEEQDVVTHTALLPMITAVEKESVQLQQHLEHLKTLKDTLGQKGLSLTVQAQKVAEVAKNMKYEDAVCFKLIDDIRKRLEYIKKVTKEVDKRKKEEIQIEKHFSAWSKSIDTMMKSIEKHLQRQAASA